ncbi:hypothetical protein [Companilactobacillus sp. DQM5]|uniref:hypothetical protein n=1 Tax=Companilactobacillus sp. DQM5 TaxID=3463359 RepID=UPI0040593CEC
MNKKRLNILAIFLVVLLGILLFIKFRPEDNTISPWKDVQTYVSENNDQNISIAVKKDNRIYTATNSRKAAYPTASVYKLAIITQLMHELKYTQNLTNDQIINARAMIETSDNDAANNLLENSLGSRYAVSRIITDLNMENTYNNPAAWGLTNSTPQDQLKILDTIFDDNNKYLTQDSKQYIKTLMNRVQDD